MTDARTIVTEALAVQAAATSGPWQPLHGESWAGKEVVADSEGHPLLLGGEGDEAAADVEAATAARTDLPRFGKALLAALDECARKPKNARYKLDAWEYGYRAAMRDVERAINSSLGAES